MAKEAKAKVETSTYEQLATAEITDKKTIVVSRNHNETGGFTIAQRIVKANDEGKEATIFLKGAFHVDDVTGLKKIRKALGTAIKALEAESEDEAL